MQMTICCWCISLKQHARQIVYLNSPMLLEMHPMQQEINTVAKLLYVTLTLASAIV